MEAFTALDAVSCMSIGFVAAGTLFYTVAIYAAIVKAVN